MWEISEALLSKAKIVAEEMLKTNEIIASVPFGKNEGVIFVTIDPALIKGTDEFVFGGRKFYIGTKNRES